MIIKVLLIAGITTAALYALRGDNSARNLALRRAGAALFVLVSAVSVVFPGLVTWVAHRVGVTAGMNLVLYVLVVAFLLVSIGLYRRMHELETRLTQVTRALTLTSDRIAHPRHEDTAA